MKVKYLLALILFGGIIMNAQENRRLIFETELNAPVETVDNAWTTADGVKSFFAPDCDININLLGDYHIYFFPEAPEGSRGAEDEILISHQKNKMLSFTWGSPPSFPNIRANQKTIVLIYFEKIDDAKSKLTFIQSGWGYGEEWDKCYQYFESAWGKVVLARLKYYFDKGPIDWNDPPDYSEYAVLPVR